MWYWLLILLYLIVLPIIKIAWCCQRTGKKVQLIPTLWTSRFSGINGSKQPNRLFILSLVPYQTEIPFGFSVPKWDLTKWRPTLGAMRQRMDILSSSQVWGLSLQPSRGSTVWKVDTYFLWVLGCWSVLFSVSSVACPGQAVPRTGVAYWLPFTCCCSDFYTYHRHRIQSNASHSAAREPNLAKFPII